MRKIFIAFVFFAVIMLSVLCFAGCGDECEHSFEEWTVSVQPTCTEQGEKERECSKCGEVQYESVKMLDHKYDTANLVWTWNGYESATVTFTCASGKTHTDTVNATVTGQITTPVTCTANGVKTYTATAKINETTYTQTKTEILTSSGHIEETVEAIAPTCTEAGLTEGKKCKECQEILTAQETVKATGHKWDTNNIVWSWNGYESAGVKLTCVSDSTHTAIAGAVISKVTKEPSANEEGYISYTATVTINGQSYTDTKTVSKSLKNTFDSAMDALINTSNGTLVEKYVNYTAAGVEDGSFSYVFELTEEALKCTYTSGSRSYVEYYTYENEVLYVYEFLNGQWVKKVKEHTGYNYEAFDKAFGKEDLWITVKNLYPSLSYDVETGTFSIAEVIIENERYINGSLVIKDGIVTKVAATRVNEDGTMRSLCFELSGYGMVSVTLPEANQGNPTDKDDNTNKKESEGLEFILSSDSSYYIVKGIGECTDTDIVIPSTYQELPVKAIASYAFARQKITSVTTQDNMLGIDSYAFYGCSELEKIVISNDVFLIQLSAFFECKALDTIIVNEKNPYYIAQDNVLYIKPGVTIEDTQITGKTLFLFPEGFAERSFTIPADVSNIAPCAFANCINLASIEIPDNVTKIGQLAFYGCTSLYDIKIGDSVELIESDAFECTGYYEDRSSWQNGLLYIGKYLIKATGNYESYTIKDGTILIADSAFSDCKKISTVVLPDSLKIIGDGCFKYLDELLSVTIGKSVEKIGINAFYGCNSLIEIVNNSALDMTKLEVSFFSKLEYMDVSNIFIVQGVTKLKNNDDGFILYSTDNGDLLVKYIGSATDVVIPESVVEIRDKAFYENTEIKSVRIGDNVKFITGSAFFGCTALDTIEIEGSVSLFDNPFYNTAYYNNDNNWDNGGFYIGTILLEVKYDVVDFTVREGTTAISFYAFHRNIEKIVIPDSVTSLPLQFWEYEKLNSITLPRNLEEIGDSMFYGCKNLASIVIPSSVKKIGRYAFYECKSLKSITIPDSVVSIGERAFSECESLAKVTIGKGVRNIGKDAFYVWAVEPLKYVYISDLGDWCNIVFANEAANPCNQKNCLLYVDGETDIIIPDGTIRINSYAFCGVKNSRIYIPKTVKYIGKSAFYTSRIISVYFEGDVAEWCGITFANATSNPLCNHGYLHLDNGSNLIDELIIPAKVTEIKNYAFFNACGIFSLSFEQGSSCSRIGDYAFRNSSLESIKIAASVKSIGKYAFESCFDLTVADINNGVSELGEYAFNNCSSLTQVVCGSAMRKIGANAFSGCTALNNVYYYGSESSWKTAEIDISNVEMLLTSIYFYSEERPTTEGNYWHYIDGNIVPWGMVIPGEIPSYAEFQTDIYGEWFEKIFVETSGTYSDMLYSSLENDEEYLNDIRAWEWVHIATKPSHTLESGMISKKEIYKLLIYDVLGGSSTPEKLAELYDTVENNTSAYMYKFIRKLASASITELSDLKKYNTSAYIDEFNAIFGDIDKLDTILKHFDCLYDAVYSCAQYQAFATMDEALKNVLVAIYNDTENPDDLKNAAKECIACYEAGFQDILTKIAEATIENEAKLLLSSLMDEVWNRGFYSIPNGWGVIALEGVRGIHVLGNAVFDFDERNKAFYQLEANVLLERAILRVLPKLYNDYTKTFDKYEAETYMRAIGVYKCIAISGFDYSIQLLEIRANASGVSKEEKAECNRLIEEIKVYKATKSNNFDIVEEATAKRYEELYKM